MASRTSKKTVNVHAEAKYSKAVAFLMRKVAWHQKRMETVTDDRGAAIHVPSAGQIKWNTGQIALHMERIEKLQQAEQGKRVSHDDYVKGILLPRMIEQADKAAAKAAIKAAPKAKAKAKANAPDPAIAILQDQIAALTLAIANMSGAPDEGRMMKALTVAAKVKRTSKATTSKARASKATANKA